MSLREKAAEAKKEQNKRRTEGMARDFRSSLANILDIQGEIEIDVSQELPKYTVDGLVFNTHIVIV